MGFAWGRVNPRSWVAPHSSRGQRACAALIEWPQWSRAGGAEREPNVAAHLRVIGEKLDEDAAALGEIADERLPEDKRAAGRGVVTLP